MNAVAGRSPMHVGGLTDDELVRLARAGHELAFDAIVHRYRAPLVSYCRRWLDAHRAEEVVQHTLMKAFLCLRDDERPLTLRPWLYRVAHNAALNALEKKGADWEELDENYDGVPQPPYVAEQRARFLRVVDGIGALPARQREALVLNEFEGRCYADIAAELGTSESGVRGLLRRARRELRGKAAALLLPFPVLRELVRPETARVDQAGELVGSAGAVGGMGAAGGLAKVAAGVLAAGTIAGGGTAIEKHAVALHAPPAQAAAAPASSKPAGAAGRDPVLLAAAAGDEAHPIASSRLTLSGGEVLPEDGAPPVDDGSYESFGGVEENSQEEPVPAEPTPSPVTAPDPLVPLASDPEEAPANGEAGDDPDSTPPSDSSSTEPSSGTQDPSGSSGTDGGSTDTPPATQAGSSPVPPKHS